MPNAVQHRQDDRHLHLERVGHLLDVGASARDDRTRRGGPCRSGSGRRATAGASRCPRRRPGASGRYSPTSRLMKSRQPAHGVDRRAVGGQRPRGRRRRPGSTATRCRGPSVAARSSRVLVTRASLPWPRDATSSAVEKTDRKILALLAADGRMSFTDLGKATGLSTSAVHQRVKRLEQRGMIRGYVATVDHEQLGLPLTAFVSITPDRPLPARRLPRAAARRSRRSSRAGRSPATSPTSSRSASPPPAPSRTCSPASAPPPTSPPAPRSCSPRRTRTARCRRRVGSESPASRGSPALSAGCNA